MSTGVTPTSIPACPAAINANFTAQTLINNPIAEVAPTATRKFDPRNAFNNMAGTLWKSNTAAFGIVIDVTTGGATGWTTDAGVDTDFTVPRSADPAPNSWMYRIDVAAKRINILPVV